MHKYPQPTLNLLIAYFYAPRLCHSQRRHFIIKLVQSPSTPGYIPNFFQLKQSKERTCGTSFQPVSHRQGFLIPYPNLFLKELPDIPVSKVQITPTQTTVHNYYILDPDLSTSHERCVDRKYSVDQEAHHKTNLDRYHP